MFKNKLRAVAAATAAIAVMISGIAPASVASAAPIAAPRSCTVQTVDGHYVTAVGGGGRITDVIHTDAVRAAAWEQFTLIDSADGSPSTHYGIRTVNGHYLTAVGGGGRITDVIHSDATRLQAWEKFTLIPLGNGWSAIQTINGHYLTAVGGGGRITDTIHSDATRVAAWEMFRVQCRTLVAVPYVLDEPVRLAAQELSAAGLVPRFVGVNTASSWVASESPAPGQLVPQGSTVTLFLRNGPVP
jgi:hypothetical protein